MPFILLADGGNEHEIVELPGGQTGLVCGGAFLRDQLPEDAAKGDDGQSFWFELDPEDAPRLIADKGSKLLDDLDLGSVLGVDAEFFGLVVEGKVVEVFCIDRPVKFVAQIGNKLVEAFDVA